MPTRETATPPPPSSFARHWIHQPGVTFLNHGSFGGCPAAVLETQQAWRARMEGEPVRFFAQDLWGLYDWARADIARFMGCDAPGMVFVPNATTGVATALHSLIASGQATAGDELLLTNHEYPACANNLRHMARASGLGVVTARIPYPNPTPQGVIEAVLAAVTPRTRIALLSHITSASALVLPIAELTRDLEARGVRVVIDGAHAPGQIDLQIGSLSPSYYTANLHKWVCSPKGSAILWAHPDQRDRCRPLVLSNMAEKPPPGRPRMHTEFDYIGTSDPTAYLCVPASLRIMASIARDEPPKRAPATTFDITCDTDTLDAAWSDLRERNRSLALLGQRIVGEALGTSPPAPAEMTACIATAALPKVEDSVWTRISQRPTLHNDALQDGLIDRWGIQVPIVLPPTTGHAGPPLRCVRVSAQLYNSPGQYEYLARALDAELRAEKLPAGSYTPVAAP